MHVMGSLTVFFFGGGGPQAIVVTIVLSGKRTDGTKKGPHFV